MISLYNRRPHHGRHNAARRPHLVDGWQGCKAVGVLGGQLLQLLGHQPALAADAQGSEREGSVGGWAGSGSSTSSAGGGMLLLALPIQADMVWFTAA